MYKWNVISLCISEVCSIPKLEGPCNENRLRWFYDVYTGHCQPFYYGGCEGNANRFESKEDCTRVCGDVSTLGEYGCTELANTELSSGWLRSLIVSQLLVTPDTGCLEGASKIYFGNSWWICFSCEFNSTASLCWTRWWRCITYKMVELSVA